MMKFAAAVRSALLACACVPAVVAVSGTHAIAAGANAQMVGNGFSSTPIKVVSENGTSWTKMEDRALALPVKIDIAMDGHRVVSYAVRQAGQPADAWIERNDNPSEEVHVAPTLSGATQLMSVVERQAVLDNCNARLGTGPGIRETQVVFVSVGLVLSASFLGQAKPGEPLGAGLGLAHTANATVGVPVQCEGIKDEPKPSYGGEASATPNFKVTGLDLRFLTTAKYVTRPDPATRCKLTKARVRVATTKAGPVKIKLWTKIGSGPMQNETVDAWSNLKGPAKFEAIYEKSLPVTKTTNVMAMAEDLTNPIGQSTGWKQVTVHCTGAGGGGFAGNPGDAEPSSFPPPPPRVRPPFVGGPGMLVGRPTPTHHTRPAMVGGFYRGGFQPSVAAGRFQRPNFLLR